MGAFLLEVHSMRGVASREMSRLQDLMEEAGARTPEGAPSLNLQDFKVLGTGDGGEALRASDRLKPSDFCVPQQINLSLRSVAHVLLASFLESARPRRLAVRRRELFEQHPPGS